MSGSWFVYMLMCADFTLYTGITTDPERRLLEHNTGPKGAKYTRVRRPVTLVYIEEQTSRAAALQREYELKSLSRAEKDLLRKKSRQKSI